MDDEQELGPSKSAVKREMTALQELGVTLVGLSSRELARIPIEDEDLVRAIDLARSINSNSGLRRQMQYIGKLMRRIDAQPIARALEELHLDHQHSVDQFHELEILRDELLSHGDAGLSALLERFPEADRQRTRTLISQHRREQSNGKPPAAARKLFKYLRELQENQGDSEPA